MPERRYLGRVHDRKLRAQLTAIARRIDANPASEVSLWMLRLAAWQPLLFKPGTQYHYSGIGYELLRLIATMPLGTSTPTWQRQTTVARLRQRLREAGTTDL